MEINLNQFDITKSKFDYEKINSLFDFYLIENKGSSFKKDSRILYEPLLNKKVIAIQYTSGASFIIMLEKDRLNRKLILELIDKHNQEFNNNLSQKQIFAPFDKYQHSLLQLFFNSLAKSKYSDNCSNIAGKLYYFSEIKRKQLYCIDFKINSDYSFSLKSKTFTEALKDSKQKKYVLQANNTLKVYDSNDKDLKQYVEGSGQYNVIITAVGNGYNVANSNDETYRFTCYHLEQPNRANSYEEIQDYQFSVERLTNQNILQINVKNYKGIDGVKVVVKVGGIPQPVIEESGYSYVNFRMDNTVPGTPYNITVQYEYSGFIDGNYYVNSLPSNVYTYIV